MMSHRMKKSAEWKGALKVLVGFLACWFGCSAFGQDALRNSLSGASNTAQKKQQFENLPYTVRWGDLKVLSIASLDSEWNDNIRLSNVSPQQDVILRPQTELSAFWPVTDFNSLNVSCGIGYEKYLRYDENDRFLITPGSELAWNFSIKDLRINVHDRFSYEHDPTAYGNVSGIARIGGLYNTAGLATIWDLHDVVLMFGYDHLNFLASSSEYERLNRASDFGIARMSARVRPEVNLGVESSGGPTDYEGNEISDFANLSAGAFAEWQVSKNIDVKARGGYVHYFYSNPEMSGGKSELPGYYIGLSGSHQLNSRISYSVEGGHEMATSIDASLIQLWFGGASFKLSVIRRIVFRAGVRYENGDPQTGGQFSEPSYERISGNIGLFSPITERLNVSLSYQIWSKESTDRSLSYDQNRVTLKLSYRF
jgi:hypothetical protein